MKALKDLSWGIWLRDTKEWAELSPRFCKPTTHNCDLVPGLIEEMWRLVNEGHDPELKRISPAELRQMRKDQSGTYADDFDNEAAPSMSRTLGAVEG